MRLSFKQFILSEADPMGGLAQPAGMPGGAPGMGMPPGGMPPGLGGPPGGGMPGMGGPPPGLGGPPGGGMPGMGGPPQNIELKTSSVWKVLDKILKGKPVDEVKKKKTGNDKPSMVNSGQPSQLPQLPPQPQQQGMAPLGQGMPPTAPPMV